MKPIGLLLPLDLASGCSSEQREQHLLATLL